MDSLTEYYFDCLFALTDNSLIPENVSGLKILITQNHVSSQRALELITRKIIGSTAEVIEHGILILHFLVCSFEEQFKAGILSMRCLELFKEIVKIPYASAKKQALEKLSVWLALYSSPYLSTEEKSILLELERIINNNQSPIVIHGRLAHLEETFKFKVFPDNSITHEYLIRKFGASTSGLDPRCLRRSSVSPPPQEFDHGNNVQEINTPNQEVELLEYSANNSSSCVNQNLCIICMDQLKMYACIPCGHKIICENCYTNSKDEFSLCPVCRQLIERFCKIYD